MLIASISGVRFTTDEPFTKLEPYVAAFLKTHQGLIVLGRDSRPSGKAISAKLARLLREAGCRVIDCGIVPTPTLTMYITKQKAAGLARRSLGVGGGIMISASHNPAEWNGLKFFNKDGLYYKFPSIP